MDSLTQIALGSAVGVAVMGRRTAVWKAALWGAIAGTLPDLDVVIDHGDAVLNMVRHRAESHSLFYLTLFAPLLAWTTARVHGEMHLFKRWWLALWLVLVTHPLLDNMTVYGTQLLMPFTDHPFAVSSVFIIDPAYTLPLIVGVIAALRLRTDRGLRWNAVALAISTAYLGWSMVAQHHVTTIARASMPAPNIPADHLLVTPSPFNTVLWRLVATTPDRYFEGYYSLLDPEPTVRWTAHPRHEALITQHEGLDAVSRIAAFSRGFYNLHLQDGRLWLTDLRMGQEPNYVFRFDLGPPEVETGRSPRQVSARQDVAQALPWLWKRMLGMQVSLPGSLSQE